MSRHLALPYTQCCGAFSSSSTILQRISSQGSPWGLLVFQLGIVESVLAGKTWLYAFLKTRIAELDRYHHDKKCARLFRWLPLNLAAWVFISSLLFTHFCIVGLVTLCRVAKPLIILYPGISPNPQLDGACPLDRSVYAKYVVMDWWFLSGPVCHLYPRTPQSTLVIHSPLTEWAGMNYKLIYKDYVAT